MTFTVDPISTADYLITLCVYVKAHIESDISNVANPVRDGCSACRPFRGQPCGVSDVCHASTSVIFKSVTAK
jgi:hypothetical protein